MLRAIALTVTALAVAACAGSRPLGTTSTPTPEEEAPRTVPTAGYPSEANKDAQPTENAGPPASGHHLRGLTPKEISTVIMGSYRVFRRCYEVAAASRPELEGQVTVFWQIEIDGSVSELTVKDSTINDPNVGECLAREVQTLVFPTAEKATRVSWPFVFRPKKQ